MTNGKPDKVKFVAAIAGGAAVVALGALGLISHEQPSAVATSTMNIGATVTETTPPAAPATPMAVPALKGDTPPDGFATTH
ncbi:hypothetical protein [Mycobacterium sp. 155]|uniref:hypothetical protein n=1 Tax=Mycobacterium sp. 155 TaxID=1157943 RepID=UPI00036CEF67|nr:hypothetical protein [Mycobacterium sp. 155]